MNDQKTVNFDVLRLTVELISNCRRKEERHHARSRLTWWGQLFWFGTHNGVMNEFNTNMKNDIQPGPKVSRMHASRPTLK
jgi:hypothetical protein